MVVNVVLPATAVDVSVLVNEKDYEAAMEVVREYEKRETGIYTNRSKSRKQCIDTPRRNAGRYPYVGTC